jgi:histidinol-phosphate aminotransferase
MPEKTSRRQWIQQTTLAAIGLGFSFRSMGNEEGLQKIFRPGTGLINLGANENPYGISPKARQAILDMIGESNRYQFNVPALESFRKTLADHYRVNEDQVLVTPGSGDGLNLLARYFSKGNIVAPDVTFGILPGTAKRIGTKVNEVPLTPGKVHDLPALLSATNDETQLIYICNPANPTATIVKPDDLKNFCAEASKKAVVVIDEAYLDFLDAPDNESMISLVEKNPRVLVVKTFSKIHGMAGLRVGFTVGHPSLIRRLQSDYFQNSQIGVSNLSLAAAMASLADEEHRLSSKQKNESARSYTEREMKKQGIAYIPSSTNFIFFPLKNYPGDYAKDMLDKHRILLRSNTYADGKWARVSVGTLDEMKIFCETLKSVSP